MSTAEITCPRCGNEIDVPEGLAKVRCTDCGSVLALGGSGRKSRKTGQEATSDNKIALQVFGGIIVLVLIIGLIVSLVGDDEEPVQKKKETASRFGSTDFGNNRRQRSPTQESSVPTWLTQRLLIAMGEENQDAVIALVWWDKLFSRLAQENNWESERRYENLDPKGKEKLRDKYLLQLMDPDYCNLIRTQLLEELKGNAAPPNGVEVDDDYGNIRYMIHNIRGKPKLEFLVKSALMPGYDPVTDVENRQAWKIILVKHESYGKVVAGRNTHTKRKAFGAELGKPEKAARKKTRRTLGPHEADPTPQKWVDGTSDSMKNKILQLVEQAVNRSAAKVRESDQSRDELISLGKTSIPGLLNGIAPLNYKDNDEDMQAAWPLIQALREIAGQRFGYGPTNATSPGRFGMTRATPEERVRAVRRWFGWWEKNAGTFVKKPETEDDDFWKDNKE